MSPDCPHCGGRLYPEDDGYEDYLVCLYCAREFDFNLTPKRMTPSELRNKLTNLEECTNMGTRRIK